MMLPTRLYSRPTTVLLEQLSMRTRTRKNNLLILSAMLKAVDQQEVTSNMAFSVISPIVSQRVIQPLWT